MEAIELAESPSDVVLRGSAPEPGAWSRDIVTEHAALTTTGGRVWAAAGRLASYLEAVGPSLGLTAPGVRVLELGAGLGWLGCTLARNLPHVGMVVVTEQEAGGGLAWLQHNVCLNAHLPGVKDKVRAVACDWLDFRGAAEGGNGDAGVAAAAAGPSAEAAERAAGAVGAATGAHGGAAGEGSGEQGHGGEEAAAAATSALACSSTAWLLSQQWDFIIGSDLVYNEVGTTYLPKVLRALASPSTRILYCHTKHRFDTHDMEFFQQLGRCGLTCTEVREPGLPTPPPSPPPLTDLFPEMRIAVYDIRLGEEAVGVEGLGSGGAA